jgi:predicted N-acetyltransferase YhbS
MTQTQTFKLLKTAAAPFAIRDERASDARAREALLDTAFGADRDARTCHRLRAGRVPATGLAFTATSRGKLVGTVRLWHVDAGGKPALVLGPLAVDPSQRDRGVGAALMRHALARAAEKGHTAVILLGDEPYYARFGFSTEKTANLSLPGPYAQHRLLAIELTDGALDGVEGTIRPTGRAAPRLRATQTTEQANSQVTSAPRAA